MRSAEDQVRALFAAAVAAADPFAVTQTALPTPPVGGRVFVLAVGKAAGRMAEAVEDAWRGVAFTGLCVTPPGAEGRGLVRFESITAAHPTPDAAGAEAAKRALSAAQDLREGDLLLALISGGGSALLPAPRAGLTLADKQATNRALLASGAPIAAVNAVRRRLSAIKGGRLAAAAFPARVVSLIVSDVPGDAPADIASGPTVPEALTRAEADALIAPWRAAVPEAVRPFLDDAGSAGLSADDPRAALCSASVVLRPRDALDAAAALARAEGLHVIDLGDRVEGEACAVARAHAALAREVAQRGDRCVILSGGETSVTVRGPGRGGRNTEYLLALALALEGGPDYAALAADTDGVDGRGPHAGAVLTQGQLARVRALGLDPAACLADNDSAVVFEALEQCLTPGPTRTNVNDFRAILLGASA